MTTPQPDKCYHKMTEIGLDGSTYCMNCNARLISFHNASQAPQPDDTDRGKQGALDQQHEPAQPKDSKSITNVSLWRNL